MVLLDNSGDILILQCRDCESSFKYLKKYSYNKISPKTEKIYESFLSDVIVNKYGELTA